MTSSSRPSERPYKKPGFWSRLRRGNLTEAQLGVVLLTPALLVLALVMLYPILTVLWGSLHGERLNRPEEGAPFVGLENFREMLWAEEMTWGVDHLLLWRLLGLALLVPVWVGVSKGAVRRGTALFWTVAAALLFGLLMGLHPGGEGRWEDPRFWDSLAITLLIIAVSVSGAFLVGLPLALLANVKSPLRWLVRAALLLPWAMPRVLVGVMFAWMFQSRGVVNDLLGRIGIEGPLWLSRVEPAVAAVNITIIWETSAFVGLLLLAGLQSIDESLFEAAKVDGASAWGRFWHITLPLLRPAIAVALIFRTLTAIQTFDVPFAMTGGGPGRALQVLGIYIQQETLSGDIGYASALSVALFALSLAITVLYLRWIYVDD